MKLLRAILQEMLGLLVDDGVFALAILLWLAAIWAGVALAGLPAGVMAVLLFVGLAGLLVESVLRHARRS